MYALSDVGTSLIVAFITNRMLHWWHSKPLTLDEIHILVNREELRVRKHNKSVTLGDPSALCEIYGQWLMCGYCTVYTKACADGIVICETITIAVTGHRGGLVIHCEDEKLAGWKVGAQKEITYRRTPQEEWTLKSIFGIIQNVAQIASRGSQL